MFKTKFRRSKAVAVGGCIAFYVSVVSGCADQQALQEQQATDIAGQVQAAQTPIQAQDNKEYLAMQRVIVNLTPSDVPVPDQVSELARKYPQAKTVRVLTSFRQVVLELPTEDMKALEAEPEVQQLALDGINTPSN